MTNKKLYFSDFFPFAKRRKLKNEPLVEQCRINFSDINKALYEAVFSRDYDVIRNMLNSGGDPNFVGATGKPLVLHAVENGDYTSVKLLLDYGANLNVRDEFGTTPLIDSVIYGYSFIAKLLIEHGADVNAMDNYMRTPLITSCIYDKFDIAMLLLKNGADVSIRDVYGKTAVDYAVQNNNTDLTYFLVGCRDGRIHPKDIPLKI